MHAIPDLHSPRDHFTVEDAQAVLAFANSSEQGLPRRTKQALEIIDEAIERYGLDGVSLSFNGGKDCTVLVHLYAAAALLHQLKLAPSSSSLSSQPKLQSIYVRCSSPFPQVEAFVEECVEWYALELEAVEAGMKEALEEYEATMKRKRGIVNGAASGAEAAIKAILVGTRRGDPHGAKLGAFAPTDAGWPDLMRVHPILDWSYAEIWDFLRCDKLTLGGKAPLEWCEMYDYGYTSLGSTHNTFPNPELKRIPDPKVHGGWLPAWELQDEAKERAGR